MITSLGQDIKGKQNSGLEQQKGLKGPAQRTQ